MTNVTFSIITITKNNAAGLEATFKSLRLQTCADYEWIIIDGASTDDTNSFLKNKNAHIISEPDTGIYNAMNKGLTKASGDYILFLNAGDRLTNEMTLDTLKNFIAQQKQIPDFIYGDALERFETTNHYKQARKHKHIKLGMFTHHQAMLYRREALSDLRYNETYTIAADYDFTAAFLQQSPNILYAPIPLCIFQSGGISQTNAKTARKEQYQIRKTLNLCTPLTNTLITTAQTLIWAFRSITPNLYWSLKSSRPVQSSGNTAPASAQI